MNQLARRLGVYDAALIVMGGIIGSGIFRNPSVVAKLVQSPALALLAWALGGVVALLGGFVFAELAARRPSDGGLYAYMRDAYHPVVAFMYGWTLLLVSQSGGAAASAVTFAGYFEPLTGVRIDERILAIATLGLLTLINCLGVRAGSNVQNFFMVLKIAAIAGLIAAGALAHPVAAAATPVVAPHSIDALTALGLAMIPVLFAYSGWQTSSFMTGELKNPARTLPLGILAGVGGVVTLYMLVNIVCIHVLGVAGLMNTKTPASDVLQAFMGSRGGQLIAAAICLSTFGFMSNQILTAPRVYHAMAKDGVFFKPVAWVHPRTRVPILAIALQGVFAIAIALLGNYDQILNYVTSIDYVFFTLSALALFVFRARDARAEPAERPAFRVPGHPVSTAIFMIAAGAVVLDTWIKTPRDSLIGLAILLAGVPIYFIFLHGRGSAAGSTEPGLP
ncbi:MAG TPA: amino acid permease [Candidatus Baltobacteraceae bacterium]|nr:amino acid permease [Candidatus Baltobacteraceae bacterium]